MARIDLLPSGGCQYKANLHCHSHLSDGEYSPEKLRDIYREKGYSVLAVTDHNRLVEHSDLNREDFLMLTGYEVDFLSGEKPDWMQCRCCHLNLYSKTPTPSGQPDEGLSRAYTPDSVNAMIRKAGAMGFLACYNHPQWSMETQEEYGKYEGCFAMEVRNYGCTADGGQDGNNILVYEDMLRHGKRLAVVASDDNHNHHPLDHPNSDSFGGFTMIAAPSLSYPAVIAALEKGDFYASGGPLITALYVEDGELVVECPPCREIIFACESRRALRVAGEPLTGARFPLLPQDGYVRIEVADEKGERAFTRAYFPGKDFPKAFCGGE